MINIHLKQQLTGQCDNSWIARTQLVQRCAQMKTEVDVHKWYESERAGQDIGWHRASISYAIRQSCTPIKL